MTATRLGLVLASVDADRRTRLALGLARMSKPVGEVGVSDLSTLALALPQPVTPGLKGRCYALWVRGLDVLLGSAILIASLPVLLLAIALIRLSSAGPVIFAQDRVGLRGRVFRMYKLRTMYRGAENDRAALQLLNELEGPVFKIKVDPRITPIGRVLRRLSIDELPQLFNVLAGNMTLVGPRPLPADEIRIDTPAERLRLTVKPGLTCLWQIAGRNEIPYRDWVELDLLYVQHRSVTLDLIILAKTPWVVLSGRGAY